MRAVPGDRLAHLPQVRNLDEPTRHAMRVVASVLPFKVNNYVLDELIDWDRAPDDPIYRLTFPDRKMLPDKMFAVMSDLVTAQAPRAVLRAEADRQRRLLHPHPGGQLELNVPQIGGVAVPGLQHKYRETVLLFPSHGQTCHSYCGYCFRWAQFVGMPDLKQHLPGPGPALDYLRAHPEVTDVLITGGDPMIMSTDHLRAYLEPLLAPELAHIRNIRIGTKALSYWPYRFLTDPDADDLLRLLSDCVASGRSLAVMTHFSHGRELSTPAVRLAITRLRETGAVLRAQAPLVRHVNDDPAVWAQMWREMVQLGVQPYYMFVERDTGAREYFALPLTRALAVYQQAVRQVSGLARTARGPVMSATPGKVLLVGETEVGGEKVFVCSFLQSREPDHTGRLFFASWSPTATWFDELRPALGTDPALFGDAAVLA